MSRTNATLDAPQERARRARYRPAAKHRKHRCPDRSSSHNGCGHPRGRPGSFNAAASDLSKTFINRHALFLTDGDVFGYDAAIGIRQLLLRKRVAHPRAASKLPPIIGTDFCDLRFGPIKGRRYASLGARACLDASSGPVAEGTVRVGTEATVGSLFEARDLKGTKCGLGSNAAKVHQWTVGMIVVSKCVGNVYDPFEKRTIEGPIGQERRDSWRWTTFSGIPGTIDDSLRHHGWRLGTDVLLGHEQLARLVKLANDNLALASEMRTC